jgi:hypothetical protein
LLVPGLGLIAATAEEEWTEDQAELRRVALAHLADGSVALAVSPLEDLQQSLPEGSWRRLEANVYQQYANLFLDLLRDDLGPWVELEAEVWGARREALRQSARELRETAPDDTIWLQAYRRIGSLEVSHRWAGSDDLLGAYGPLFQYWAESTDLPRARRAYLELVWELEMESSLDYQRHEALRSQVENAATIARGLDDVRRFSWLWARWLERHTERPADHVRQGAALRRAIEGPDEGDLELLAQVLLEFGQWASRYGRDFFAENGELRFEPDWTAAVRAYERVLQLPDDPAMNHLRRQAENALAVIREPLLEVFVPAQFRPETEVNFFVRWRNLDRPTIYLWPLPTASVGEGIFDQWKHFTPPPGLLPIADLDLTLEPRAPFRPVQERVRISQPLEPGAYLVEARAGDEIERELLLVNDLVTVIHRTDHQWTLFAGDPESGAPVGDAEFTRILRWNGEIEEAPDLQLANENGLAEFTLPEGEGSYSQRFVAWAPDRGVTVAEGFGFQRATEREGRMVAYTLTDRLLYRPGEKVEAKVWVRYPADDGGWALPEPGCTFVYRVRTPNGEVLSEGHPRLAENGAVVFSLDLPEDAMLGAYQFEYEVSEAASGRSQSWWESPFRVEAFRTPELEARIELEPPPTGTRLAGDVVRGQVVAEFYAGGAVEDATVELIVRRRPFWRAMPFGEEDPASASRLAPQPWFGGGEEITRLALRTDNQGRASFEFATRDEGDQGWVYTLKALIRDLSRQEVTADREVILARQTHFVDLRLERRLIGPGDRAELTVRSVDPNGNNVSDRGTLRITRERWREIYVHRRRGDEITGDEFRQLPERSLLLAAQSDYDLRESGFVTEEVLVAPLETGRDGRVSFAFEPAEAGYYLFNWVSQTRRGQPVTAETPLWVSDRKATEIGYRPGGIEIISDRGPHRVGEPIPFLLSAPDGGRTVLLSFSGKEYTETRVMRLEGTSVMAFFTPTEVHQPNAFAQASMISREEVFADQFEWEVPLRDQFLEISVEPNADGYEPRDEAQLTVRVRDAAGDPVATEVAVLVTDQALLDLLGEERTHPSEVFYRQKNRPLVRVGSSLAGKPYYDPLQEDWDAEEFGEEAAVQYAMDAEGGADKRTAFARPPADALGIVELEPPPPPDLATPRMVRTDFRPTALWQASVQTDESGTGEVTFSFPDNLTSWRAEAVVVTDSTQVGEGFAETATRLPLIVRLQTPRFFTEHDEVVLSGTFQNNSEQSETVSAEIAVSSHLVLDNAEAQQIEVPPGGVRRVEWRANVASPGEARITLQGASTGAADAIERIVPVAPHGFFLQEGGFGFSPDNSVTLALELPAEVMRSPEYRLQLRATPTIATELFSALPYLIEFPYGCTEQTLSRFLPALAARGAVSGLGYPLGMVDGLAYGGLSPEAREGRENLSAVLDEVIADAIERLGDSQLADGSFPWVLGGSSDAYMTAYAVYTLTLAIELGVELERIDLEGARDWLERAAIEGSATGRPALQAWMLHALASRYRAAGYGRPSRLEARAFLRLMERRDSLGPFSLALLALTAKDFGFVEDADLLLRNLENFAVEGEAALETLRDAAGQPLVARTLHWGKTERYFRWEEGAVEATAMVLQAMLAIRPDDPSIRPAVTWLARNRTGNHWNNTRSTALVVLALSEYLGSDAAGLQPSDWEVQINGETYPLSETFAVDGEDNPWPPPLELVLGANQLKAGRNEISIHRLNQRGEGGAPFYLSWNQSWYATDDPIPAASNELSVARDYEHLMPVPTLLRGVREQRRALHEGDQVRSGERVEVLLTIESPRELRYVLLEDVKPSGFEAVQLLSGMDAWLEPVVEESEDSESGVVAVPPAPRRFPVYQQMRDRTVAFLIDRLPAGKWQLRYRLRAESPGTFHALPARAEAFYLPDIRGNAAEQRIGIEPEPSSNR